MWTGVTEEPERGSEYGYGAQISTSNGNRVIWHGGGWNGVTNQFDIFPELGYSVAILSNYDDDPGSIDYKIREWLTQGKPAPSSDPSGPPLVTVEVNSSTQNGNGGQPITFQLAVTNSGGTAHAATVDLEVKHPSSARVFQRFTADQKLVRG